jgi:hypothetical protein
LGVRLLLVQPVTFIPLKRILRAIALPIFPSPITPIFTIYEASFLIFVEL